MLKNPLDINSHAGSPAQKIMKLVRANSVRPWRTNNPEQHLIDNRARTVRHYDNLNGCSFISVL